MGFIEEIVSVEDIKETMDNLSTVQDIHINEIDFTILDTKYKVYYTDGRNETFDNHEFKMRIDEHLSSTKVKQILEIYDIEFFETEEGFLKHNYFSLFVSKQKVKCAIKVLSEPKFIVDMKEYLLKLLAYDKILTLYNVDEAAKKITEGSIQAGDKILITKSLLPVPPKDEHVEFNFDVDKDENDFTEIEKGDEILRLYHGVSGKAGRDLYGEVINIRNPNNIKDGLKIDDESVVVLKNKKYDTYYSKLKGFIDYKDNYLEINNRMVMTSSNKNKTENLGTDIENEIALEIIQDSDQDDSVSDGINVKTTSIDTKGSIGKNVMLDTESAQIDGHTHITSKIKSKEATISTLRGDLESVSAVVNEVMNANVKVETLNAKVVIGSTIKMVKGKIKDVRNNNIITVSKKLDIEKLSGNGNVFKLLIDDGSELQKDHDELSKELEVMKKGEITLKDKLKQLIPQTQKIQEKLKAKRELSTLEKRTMLNVKESKKKYSAIQDKIKQTELDLEQMLEDIKVKQKEDHSIVITNSLRTWTADNRFEIMTDNGLVFINTDGSERGRKLTFNPNLNKIVIK